jgi:glutaredoxin-related protein
MLKIYGSMLCPDCVQCRADLDKAGVAYEYLDFSESLLHLKEFLVLRENPIFDTIRSEGKIGIPCLVKEDGTLTLTWEEYM